MSVAEHVLKPWYWLAGKIFEERSEKLSDLNTKQMEAMLSKAQIIRLQLLIQHINLQKPPQMIMAAL